MSTASPIPILIVTYNRWQDTRACLESVFASTGPDYRILVLDNGSVDETLDTLPREFPRVELVCSPTNLGYAEGNNVGLRRAIHEGAEFVVILNNDVTVAPDWLEQLTGAARGSPQTAFVGPLVLHASEPTIIQSAGGLLESDWHACHRGANDSDVGQYAQPERVDWLTGCAVLARCAAVQRIGLLDPDFYMYGEDVDWGTRARRAGYDVLLAPAARVWHKGVQRDYEPAPYITYYSARNELQLIRKHGGSTTSLVKALARHTRTLTSWTVRPRWQKKRAHRDALARALRDFFRGTSGQIQGQF